MFGNCCPTFIYHEFDSNIFYIKIRLASFGSQLAAEPCTLSYLMSMFLHEREPEMSITYKNWICCRLSQKQRWDCFFETNCVTVTLWPRHMLNIKHTDISIDIIDRRYKTIFTYKLSTTYLSSKKLYSSLLWLNQARLVGNSNLTYI